MPDYRDFFSLKQSPFQVQAIRPLVLETGPLRRAAAWIRSELAAEVPLLAVFGSRGIGKSSTAMALPHLLEDRVALVPDPTRPWNELAGSIATQFELDSKTLSRADLLAGRPSPTVRLVLVVDDAEELPDASLASLQRVIAYTDRRERPLVRCILFAKHDGRASLATRWATAIQSRFELTPMLARELHRYVEARLENAGWKGGELFTRDAIEAVHLASGGSPPAANRICEALLVQAAQRQQRSIGQDLVHRVCEELGVSPVAVQEEVTEPALRVAAPALAPEAVPGDAPLSGHRAAPAATAEERATESAPPSGTGASDDEAIPPPANPDPVPSRTTPDPDPVPSPANPDPVPLPEDRSAPEIQALTALVARWDRRRWHAAAAVIGLIAALFFVGRVATMQTGEPETLERTAGSAARVADEHTEPTLPIPEITVKAASEWQLESEPASLAGLHGEAEGTAQATAAERTEGDMAVDPERAEGGEPVASEETETPGLGVAQASKTGRTQTAERVTAVSWLDDLDLVLDTEKDSAHTPSPTLALPEPELSPGFSPGGETR